MASVPASAASGGGDSGGVQPSERTVSQTAWASGGSGSSAVRDSGARWRRSTAAPSPRSPLREVRANGAAVGPRSASARRARWAAPTAATRGPLLPSSSSCSPRPLEVVGHAGLAPPVALGRRRAAERLEQGAEVGGGPEREQGEGVRHRVLGALGVRDVRIDQDARPLPLGGPAERLGERVAGGHGPDHRLLVRPALPVVGDHQGDLGQPGDGAAGGLLQGGGELDRHGGRVEGVEHGPHPDRDLDPAVDHRQQADPRHRLRHEEVQGLWVQRCAMPGHRLRVRLRQQAPGGGAPFSPWG